MKGMEGGGSHLQERTRWNGSALADMNIVSNIIQEMYITVSYLLLSKLLLLFYREGDYINNVKL